MCRFSQRGKQKSNFLAVFALAEKACGHYFALLGILASSQYLILQAAISHNGPRVCVRVCGGEAFCEDFHNIDSQLSLCSHLLLPLHLSGATVQLFCNRKAKCLTPHADGRFFFLLNGTRAMNNTMTNELLIERSGPAADARASDEIVTVAREFTASQTEGCVFMLRNIRIREGVMGSMLFKMWCQIGRIVTRVILFTLKTVCTMSKHPGGWRHLFSIQRCRWCLPSFETSSGSFDCCTQTEQMTDVSPREQLD